jgi:hypothetical protein
MNEYRLLRRFFFFGIAKRASHFFYILLKCAQPSVRNVYSLASANNNDGRSRKRKSWVINHNGE